MFGIISQNRCAVVVHDHLQIDSYSPCEHFLGVSPKQITCEMPRDAPALSNDLLYTGCSEVSSTCGQSYSPTAQLQRHFICSFTPRLATALSFASSVLHAPRCNTLKHALGVLQQSLRQESYAMNSEDLHLIRISLTICGHEGTKEMKLNVTSIIMLEMRSRSLITLHGPCFHMYKMISSLLNDDDVLVRREAVRCAEEVLLHADAAHSESFVSSGSMRMFCRSLFDPDEIVSLRARETLHRQTTEGHRTMMSWITRHPFSLYIISIRLLTERLRSHEKGLLCVKILQVLLLHAYRKLSTLIPDLEWKLEMVRRRCNGTEIMDDVSELLQIYWHRARNDQMVSM